MHTHEELIRKFYTAFQQLDYRGMQSCYHDEVTFSDPVFQSLKGNEARAMWQMLIIASTDLIIQFDSVEANNENGQCHWEAFYTFSRTGRKVHNRIEASFKFKDGKIIEHIDQFDLWRWSRMALGISGVLLGWTPIVRNKIRKMARYNLDKFISSAGI
ncbi:MAG: nuclear transport factor 2 family protein [Cyclobacteriaceae bacterium]|nr:nuclear transport factor 2 family protein [Cyclobacteriaceae bacterium]